VEVEEIRRPVRLAGVVIVVRIAVFVYVGVGGVGAPLVLWGEERLRACVYLNACVYDVNDFMVQMMYGVSA
jgi:hypothetical protein